MTKDEALKLALEAMEGAIKAGDWVVDGACDPDWAIHAIKQVLAEQPNTKANSAETAKQISEPVAWKHDCSALLQNDVELWVDRCPHCGKPRTTPQAQRTWVGLTDEEIEQGLLRSGYALQTAHAWRAGVVFAMTKLKEKNNA